MGCAKEYAALQQNIVVSYFLFWDLYSWNNLVYDIEVKTRIHMTIWF